MVRNEFSTKLGSQEEWHSFFWSWKFVKNPLLQLISSSVKKTIENVLLNTWHVTEQTILFIYFFQLHESTLTKNIQFNSIPFWIICVCCVSQTSFNKTLITECIQSDVPNAFLWIRQSTPPAPACGQKLLPTVAKSGSAKQGFVGFVWANNRSQH